MTIFVNLVIFFASAAVLWFFAGSLVSAVDRLAKHLHKSGFSVAFLVLGLLTSISEFSVATNSILAGAPEVSVGNLIGATFVIMFLIIPIFAIAGNGIRLAHAISQRNLLFALAAIMLPALLVMDGNVTATEGLLSILVYAALFYAIRRQHTTLVTAAPEPEQRGVSTLFRDIGRIVVGAIGIFLATHFLVEESVYFANLLTIPASLIGLLILSIGTNLPELVIAVRSIAGKRMDIAFGDYLGSASMNLVIFGFVAIASGTFFLEASEFFLTTSLMLVGVPLFYLFARSEHKLSRMEGGVLLLFYVVFLVIQLANLVRFATT
ncbi:hypothetical protein K2Y00_01725 [Patescibacteria group bacterium]|nr:hypothetical protein [Patescibacteria group bacterium]